MFFSMTYYRNNISYIKFLIIIILGWICCTRTYWEYLHSKQIHCSSVRLRQWLQSKDLFDENFSRQWFVFIFQSFTVAIVVPDGEVLEKYAREKTLPTDLTILCKKKEIKELIFKDIKQLEKSNGLKGFECVSFIWNFIESIDIRFHFSTRWKIFIFIRKHFQLKTIF